MNASSKYLLPSSIGHPSSHKYVAASHFMGSLLACGNTFTVVTARHARCRPDCKLDSKTAKRHSPPLHTGRSIGTSPDERWPFMRYEPQFLKIYWTVEGHSVYITWDHVYCVCGGTKENRSLLTGTFKQRLSGRDQSYHILPKRDLVMQIWDLLPWYFLHLEYGYLEAGGNKTCSVYFVARSMNTWKNKKERLNG